MFFCERPSSAGFVESGIWAELVGFDEGPKPSGLEGEATPELADSCDRGLWFI